MQEAWRASRQSLALLVGVPVGGLVHPPELIAFVAAELLVVGLHIYRLIKGNLGNEIRQPSLRRNVFVLPFREPDREPRLVQRLVELRVAEVRRVLTHAAVDIRRDLRAVISSVG